jgi:hypothetical protein
VVALVATLAVPASANAAPRRAARQVPVAVSGVIQSVDATAGTFTVQVTRANRRRAALVGTTVTVSLGRGASVRITGQRGTATVAALNAGDTAVVFGILANGAITAMSVTATVPATPPPPPPAPTYWTFDGSVSAMNPKTGTFTVSVTAVSGGAPASDVGASQSFTVSSTTLYSGLTDRTGDGLVNLADVFPGDTVEVSVVAPTSAPAAGSSLSVYQLTDNVTAPTGPPTGSS